MKYAFLFLFLMVLVLGTGCSDDKKEEAARLEQELMGDDSTSDMAAKQGMPADTTATSAMAVPKHEPGAVPSEKKVNLPGKPAGSGFSVQIAGCENPDYATYLVDVYTRRGYEPYVTQATVDGQVYYRVRIGLFATLTEAKTLQAELLDKYSISPWIDLVS